MNKDVFRTLDVISESASKPGNRRLHRVHLPAAHQGSSCEALLSRRTIGWLKRQCWDLPRFVLLAAHNVRLRLSADGQQLHRLCRLDNTSREDKSTFSAYPSKLVHASGLHFELQSYIARK